MPFNAKDFWRRNGIDPDTARLISLRISDPYFITPKAWGMVYALIAAVRTHHGASLEIKTWDPEAHCQNSSDPNWFRMPSWGGRQGSPADVKCDQNIVRPLQETDARAFAECLRTKLYLNRTAVHYLPQRPDHDRWMDFVFTTSTGQETGRLWIGKGFDLLSFTNDRVTKLFSPQAENLAFYADTANVFRE